LDKQSPSIKDLTSLGIFSGRISEVHFKNLQSFPFMFFGDLTQVALDYDIGQKKEQNSWVSYDLSISKENDSLDKRFFALESAVRAIFWKEVVVKISINEKEVYKSV
jgi:hypothetical protein